MQLRRERPDDRDDVAALHRAAFGAHGEKVGRLVDSLRSAPAAKEALSVVADESGQIVGHAMFTRSLLDAPRQLVSVSVLSPVAVVPERQGEGIGSAMVRHGLAVLDRRSVPLVFLEGDPAYYGRFGFVPGRDQGFRRPSLRIPEPAFQAIRLSAYEPWMSGTLVYSETFWRHDAVGLRDGAA